MTDYGKPRQGQVASNPTLKSKEERKKILEEVERRRSIIYKRFYQKKRIETNKDIDTIRLGYE